MHSMDTITQELLEIINAHLLQRAEEAGKSSETGLLTSLDGDLELSNYINSLDFIMILVNIEKKFNVVLQGDLNILTDRSFIQIAEFIAKNRND
jgi:acyl carrier protein